MVVELAKKMWGAYAIQAGGKTFDGKPLPNWDELGEDRQSCWVAAASVLDERVQELTKLCEELRLSHWKMSEALRKIAKTATEYEKND